jgi:hypothetical protein
MDFQVIRNFRISPWAVVVLPLSYLLVNLCPITSTLFMTVLILDV